MRFGTLEHLCHTFINKKSWVCIDLKICYQSSGPSLDRGTGYSLHQLQGDKQAGMTRTGHLMKKSEGKMRRVWQKRRCCVQAEGFLEISHGDETKPPTRVNLLTCQVKMVPDDKRCFDVLSCKLFHCIFDLVFMLVKCYFTKQHILWITIIFCFGFLNYIATQSLAKFEMRVVMKILCEQNLRTADIYRELCSVYTQNSSRKYL